MTRIALITDDGTVFELVEEVDLRDMDTAIGREIIANETIDGLNRYRESIPDTDIVPPR